MGLRNEGNKEEFDHLIKNLERITFEDSIFNYKTGHKAFLSLGQGNIHEWLEKLLPNTRLIIEPKIIGSRVALQYINGKLIKAINENTEDLTKLEITIFNMAMVDAIKTAYKDPFEPVFEKDFFALPFNGVELSNHSFILVN